MRLAGIVVAALVAVPVFAASSLSTAEDRYRRTDYEASLAVLNKDSKDATTNFLIGRDYFMIGDFKKSVDYLQRAVAEDGKNAEYVDWLGRAYGKRAETGNPFTAPGFATKARQAFEQSVALNPRDPDALSDLFDYYLDAPGFLGGGAEKAEAVIEKIRAVDPPEAQFEEAKLAQRRREFDSAEQHLLRAIQATPQKVSGLLEYARFLASQGRTKESDAALLKAEQMKPNSPSVWYAKADLLIRQKRDFPQAKTLLVRYLQASVTVDDPPKQDAQKLLRQIGGA